LKLHLLLQKTEEGGGGAELFLRLKNIQEENKGREPGYTAANLWKRTETSTVIFLSVTVDRNQAQAGSVDKHACGQAGVPN